MKTNERISIILTIAVAIVSTQVSAAPLINDTNYKIETYASFDSSGMGGIYGSGFDGQGSLYVTYLGTQDVSYQNGSIAKITPSDVTTRWADNLSKPTRVVWTGGTDYGDKMYVMEYLKDKVKILDGQGNHSSFATVYHSPVSLALDRSGNYGNMLYAGTSSHHGIHSITTSGTVSQLGNFPGDLSGGGFRDMEFSPTAKYGGNMFVGMKINGGPYDYMNGIFRISTTGMAERFAMSINLVDDMAFDPVGTQFDNDLFIIGSKEGVAGNHVWRIDESGNAVSLALLSGCYAPTLTFGLDGSLYISTLDLSNDQTNIYKISEVPEPASLMLLGLGGFLIRRRRKN